LYAQTMVRFTVLASGSKGNSTVISAGRTRILVDAGLSCRELFRRMRLAGEDPATLDAIVITHEHQDHINGLAVTARKLGVPVYFTEATHRAWMRWLTPRRQMSYAQWLELCRKQAAERQAEPEAATPAAEAAECDPEESETESQQEAAAVQDSVPDPAGDSVPDPALGPVSAREPADLPGIAPPTLKEDPTWLPAVEYFEAGRPFTIGDVSVSPFTIPHDAADPVGFVFTAEGVRMGFATDLGYVTPNVKQQLRSLDLLLLESNHDLEMLRGGPYPWSVKQRVMSRVGHLSNEALADFFANDYDGSASYIVLAHLSEQNNHPEVARRAAEMALGNRCTLLHNRVMLAGQAEAMQPIRF
jgi:phosphoribosyl 1,2-cyclic phosphodiesterase